MSADKVIQLKNPGSPGTVADALTEVLREGAQRLLASAIEAEVNAFLERFQAEKTAEGLNRMVRNGRLPNRTIQTGIGDSVGRWHPFRRTDGRCGPMHPGGHRGDASAKWGWAR